MQEPKKVAWQILSLYLISIGSVLAVLFGIWYAKLKDDLIREYEFKLRQDYRFITIQMEKFRFNPISVSAPAIAQLSNIKFAIFDRTKVYFSNLDFPAQTLLFKLDNVNIYDNKLIYIADARLNNALLGNFRKIDTLDVLGNVNRLKVLIQGDDVSQELAFIRFKVAFMMIFSLICVGIVGYFILKFALKPLEMKINFLNNFIKDATHEINTPISAILMSIESLEKKQDFTHLKPLKRIKIAALTLNHIYSDLTFLNFYQAYSSNKEWIFLKPLIIERIEYFKIFVEQKNITLKLDLQDEGKILINKEQFFKMFDNLLGNAIKYNIKNGHIKINLYKEKLMIKDSGCGISETNLRKIFDRYMRFNNDQGGFGIGLSLVKKICDEHRINIEVQSKLKEGTCFVLTWKN